MSTYVCTLEMLSWEGYSRDEQKQLCALYVPYLGLGNHVFSPLSTRTNSSSRSDGHRYVLATKVEADHEEENTMTKNDSFAAPGIEGPYLTQSCGSARK